MTRKPIALGLAVLSLVLFGVFAAYMIAKPYDDFSAGGGYSDAWHGDGVVQEAIKLLPEQKREASLKVFEDLKKLPLDSLLNVKVAPCHDWRLLDCRDVEAEDVRAYVDLAMERLKVVDAVFSRNVALCSLAVSFLALMVAYFKFRLDKPR